MSLNLLDHCTFNGPALPEPFVRFELEKELTRLDLLGKTTGEDGKKLQVSWDVYRRKMRELDVRGGPLRVRHCIVDPLVERLGFAKIEDAPEVTTREGGEEGGYLLVSSGGGEKLRVWTTDFDDDLDAPARRGAAYRFSHLRIAQRVLLTAGERVGILTNGVQLRILISDPARPDSEVIIPLESAWKRHRDLPDSYRFLLALCQPKGIAAIPELVEKARLQQARVTKDLRLQARRAVEHFVQEILDHPANAEILSQYDDRQELAKTLWQEGLVLVYRLLFILKLESTDDPARSFSFASSSLWRNTFSPGVALARRVRDVLDRGEETGRFLEDALRRLFEMCTKGLDCSELHMRPLGGALFGPEAAPVLDNPALRWGERAVAFLLDQLLWTEPKRGGITRQRVHYGALDVEDLGRVYEALLELEAGIATELLCRLRRQKLEVVVPAAQGQRYRTLAPVALAEDDVADESSEPEAEDEAEDETASSGKSKIEWIEEIPPYRFYLRVGLGRKASGSYYTPHSFVRFLVQETLGPLCAARSPQNDPNPGELLRLKVLDPAMGSGHFLVEACRFLAEKLYEACRLCDERATPKEIQAENALDEGVRKEARAEAQKYRQRVLDLPDPNDEIVQYLPSRAPEGFESGVSQRRAMALCRRLIAVHCLYGVDKNRLAVELAKLSLWIESHGEGLPLTFLDHRLVLGDSLTGPFFQHLLTYPNDGSRLDGLFADGMRERLTKALSEALVHIRELEATVGTSISEMEAKRAAKARSDKALRPFRAIAAAWAGHVMTGAGTGAEYTEIIRAALAGDAANDPLSSSDALPYEFMFPEVFFPAGTLEIRQGFDTILGNPPWEGLDTSNKEFFAAFDFSIMDLRTDADRKLLMTRLLALPHVEELRRTYDAGVESYKRIASALFRFVNQSADKASAATPDMYQLFAERAYQLAASYKFVGLVLPSAFHSNDGAAGLRRLYLENMRLRCCYSFENRRQLFEIHRSFKFATIVAARDGTTDSFSCCFYLDEDSWLFSDKRTPEPLVYSRSFITSTTGRQLNFLELRRQADMDPALTCYKASRERFGELRRRLKVLPTEELHSSKQKWRLVLTSSLLSSPDEDPRDPEVHQRILAEGSLPWHEGKTIHQFSDHWAERPTYCVPLINLADKATRLNASRFYRLGFRKVARSNDERSAIFTMIPPGYLTSDSLLIESIPHERPYTAPLLLMAVANAFTFDWLLRLAVSANITYNFLDPQPIPDLTRIRTLLIHAALRLVCNHSGYEALWANQLDGQWREANAIRSWPVLQDAEARWQVRAAVDAALARAYGLDRTLYQYILSGFDHSSQPSTPQLCLEKFDQLICYGIDVFVKQHDPYWDVPLNELLPEPATGIPGASEPGVSVQGFALSSPAAAPKRGRRGR